MLTHLSTTNDTVVNGERIKKHTLSSGELIQVGLSQLLFQSLVIEEEFVVPEAVNVDTAAVEFEPPVETAPESEVATEPEPAPEPVEEYVYAGAGWGAAEENSWAPSSSDDGGGWAPTLHDDDDSGWNPR